MKKIPWHGRGLFALSAVAGSLFIAPVQAQITAVTGVDLVARLTGTPSLNNTTAVNIGGTDLGHMVVHQGKTYFLFGDTFSGETSTEGGSWRNNTMAWSTDATPANGIVFDGWITNTSGKARQVIGSGYMNPITEIPTGAISVGNRIYAWFMSVNWWGPAGQWTINYAGLAYTENLGQRFTIVTGFRLPSATNFGMVAASTRTDLPAGTDDYIYVWGTPAGRFGGVKLARVLPADVPDPAAYQYFGGLVAGQPTWVIAESAAPLIVSPTVGEMSVMYNQAARRWMLLYTDHSRYAIELRQAKQPWGPWSEPLAVAYGSQYSGLYGSYMNPLYVENNGETIYFTMSLWWPYDVYFMRARLTVPPPFSPADLDQDGDVDFDDLARFRPCLSGDAVLALDAAACSGADLDHDGDIDLSDYALMQRCLSGPLHPSDPACMN